MCFFNRFSRILRFTLLFSLFLSCLGLAGCPFPPKIHRIDVRQGHYITPELVAQLRNGMSKESVIEIMGTPTLCPINNDRLDYYYYLKPGCGTAIQQKHLVIFFVNDRVRDITWGTK